MLWNGSGRLHSSQTIHIKFKKNFFFWRGGGGLDQPSKVDHSNLYLDQGDSFMFWVNFLLN